MKSYKAKNGSKPPISLQKECMNECFNSPKSNQGEPMQKGFNPPKTSQPKPVEKPNK